MTSAEEALKIVFKAAFTGPSALWGVNIESNEVASATLRKPCLIFFVASNARALVQPLRKNALLVVSVKGVAENAAMAYAMQDAISGLLDDSGRQDNDPRLPGNADWDITTVTEMRAIWLQEPFSQGKNFYHAGHQYQVRMERKS